METLLHVGLSNAAVGAVLAVVLLPIAGLLRRPALTHALCVLIMVKLVTPPVWHVPVGWITAGATAAAVEPIAPEAPQPALVHSESNPASSAADRIGGPGEAPVAPDPVAVVGRAPSQLGAVERGHLAGPLPSEAPAISPAGDAGRAAHASWAVDWRAVLPWGWLAGSALCLGWVGLRLRLLQRLLRFAEPAPMDVQRRAALLGGRLGLAAAPAVWLAPGSVCPMLLGLPPRARLYVSAGLWARLAAPRRDALLLHELAHYRRRDHWARPLEMLVTCLYWWHPAVWWTRRSMRDAEEQCCDAWAVWGMGGASAREYAAALLDVVDFASRGRPVAAVPALASGMGEFRHLKRRLTMIHRRSIPRTLTWSGLAAVCALGAMLLPLGPMAAQTPDSPPAAGDAVKADGGTQRAAAEGEKGAPGVDDAEAPPLNLAGNPAAKETFQAHAELVGARLALRQAEQSANLSLAARAAAQPAALPPKEALPIYLHADALAEAEKPSLEIGGGNLTLVTPGPERLYGHALRDLRDYLNRMTGGRHELTLADAGADRGIFAGTFAQFPKFVPRTAAGQQAMQATDPEAFVVEAQGERLFVLGKTNLGLIAAAYTLLDRLGCKWFAPGADWENVPRLPQGLALDDKLNAASAGPSYRSRLFAPGYGPNTSVANPAQRQRDYALWCLRNLCGGSAYTANTHNVEVIPPALIDTRPELFADVGEEARRTYQAYMKNGRLSLEVARCKPEVVQLAVENAVKYFKRNEGKGSYYNSFSVEPGDGVPRDRECLKKFGNATDLDFWFANQVAAGIERAGLTDKWVGLLSYHDHATIPSFDLHPQVAVVVTTNLDTSSGGLTIEQRLEGLRGRKARLLGVYDYFNLITWSWDRPGQAFAAHPLQVADKLKQWHASGARTFMAESSDSWVSGGVGHYLAARLLWDLARDPQKELDAYYDGAFGPAAGEIRALFESWAEETWRARPPITRGHLARWHQLISAADEKVRDVPNLRTRINDIKRYYLYLNLVRELDIDLGDPRVPSRAERYNRVLRYVAVNRGEGCFHAVGLLFTLLHNTGTPLGSGVGRDELDASFKEILKGIDEKPWGAFPPLGDEQVDRMFADARLPLGGRAAVTAVLDPAVKVVPAAATAPAEIRFPELHNAGTGVALQHVLQVVAPTPRLSLELLATGSQGGAPVRSVVITDELDRELKRLECKAGEPAVVELADVRPGTYRVSWPDLGAARLTVRGGNTFGAARGAHDVWGFNPIAPAAPTEGQTYRAYFVVPAGQGSLDVRLATGTVALGFKDGPVIVPEIHANVELTKPRRTRLEFAPADQPRIAYVEWKGHFLLSTGFVIEGVTLYSPDPSYALYEALD